MVRAERERLVTSPSKSTFFSSTTLPVISGSLRKVRISPGSIPSAPSEDAVRRFLGALLAELKETLSSEGGRMRISRRHGVDACVALADIIKRIESYTA